MKLLRNLFAAIGVLLILVVACDDGTLDLSQFTKDPEKAFAFKDVPDSINLLVGEEVTLIVRAETPLEEFNITSLSDSSNICEAMDLNDSTVILKGAAAGVTTVQVRYTIFSKEIKVRVEEKFINSITLSTYKADMYMGDSLNIYITTDPADFPASHLQIIEDSTLLEIFGANYRCDSVKGKDYIQVRAASVGTGEFKVRAMKADRTYEEKTVKVTCRPLPVKELVLRVPVDSTVVGHDTIYVYDRVSGKKTVQSIKPRYKYSYEELKGSELKIGRKDVVRIGLAWKPESASVCEAGIMIQYVCDSLDIKWSEEISSKKDTMSVETMRHLMDSLKISSYEDYQKFFGGNGYEPSEYAKQCGVYRDYSGSDLYLYKIVPKQKSTVIFDVSAEYYTDMNRKKGAKTKKFFVRITENDHEKWEWWKK